MAKKNTNNTEINHLQWKLIDQCKRNKLSVEQTFQALKDQRSLCQRMIENADEVFARKVFKKSVMTVASYGATQRSSRDDVISQLKAVDDGFIYSLTPSEVTMMCNLVFWSLDAAVPSSMVFLQYFKKLIAFVLKYKDVVQFRNPINNFPVVLRVADEESIILSYKVHGKSLSSRINRKMNTTNKRKTTSSTVPSIIHSADAAILHMIKHNVLDIEMAVIHDSVGSHPNDLTKAKESVSQALLLAAQSQYFESIKDQLLKDIPVEDIPEELLEVPNESTWDNWEQDILNATNAYM